ncbi:hypothetical protein RH915_03210 [Serpentinicella sp. ANB-PHB4]|uniref:hypothetical protein n=1 Tax=Serpentinicella sp. ANB-PHB4 TaxID=3074076 RepID=UPI00285D21BC|nr:hypothetical protein [Serpentinicella sp. ANB-PHB4]MDR5658491.1 hypothetical protein [Serpentinicella sp. ANB-PHB4]
MKKKLMILLSMILMIGSIFVIGCEAIDENMDQVPGGVPAEEPGPDEPPVDPEED